MFLLGYTKQRTQKLRKGQICTNSYKFVDDGINTNQVNMRQATMLEDNSARFKEVVDMKTERLLNPIATNAEAKGMRINAKKTSLMCVSASTSFTPKVRVSVQGQ